jgi:hypothetical protein
MDHGVSATVGRTETVACMFVQVCVNVNDMIALRGVLWSHYFVKYLYHKCGKFIRDSLTEFVGNVWCCIANQIIGASQFNGFPGRVAQKGLLVMFGGFLIWEGITYHKFVCDYAMARYKKMLANLQEVNCVSILQCGLPEAVCLW